MTGATEGMAVCANCNEHRGVAFTLTTHVRDGDETVEADFCCSDCLAEWTTVDGADRKRRRRPAHPRVPSRRARTY